MPNKKKVLLAITKSNFGGAQRYVFDIASKLDKNKFDITVLFGNKGLLKQKLDETGIRTITIDKLGRDIRITDEISVFVSLLKILREEKPDVFHVNSSKIGGLGALAGRLAGVKKIIFTVHGWPFNEKRPAWQILLIKFLSWLTVLLAHKTITICKADFAKSMNWPFVKNKIVVIRNGVESFELLNRDTARDQLLFGRNNNDVIWVGSIGELVPNYNHKIAIEAIAKINSQNSKKIYYTIIGTGELKNDLQKLIDSKNAGGEIILTDFIDNAKSYLKAFDILLYPIKKVGLPYVLLEAGLAKTPVIATSIGGIPEVISDYKSGILLRKNDSEEIVKLLSELNLEKLNSFGENLCNEVIKNYSIPKMLEELERIYLSRSK